MKTEIGEAIEYYEHLISITPKSQKEFLEKWEKKIQELQSISFFNEEVWIDLEIHHL